MDDWTSSFYGPEQRELQERFGTRPLADVHEAAIVADHVDDDRREFIESRDFFFLSTVDADGWPTVSYKGGPPGLVHVEDERTVVFPSYDGNGMFLSMGNVEATSRIAMLFIDLETPNRLRLRATASVHHDDPALARYPGAQLLVRAHVEHTFVNCARYVHPHRRVEASRHVPDADGSQPVPAWKRIDLLQPALGDHERERTESAGGTIDVEEYARRLADGTS
ncbi:pyridoxamine 5'-phosphate oxidase family protein [Ilumatobacter sp.]|uniref:pyridoxamine 5'-phosphate oxidase family protein n=1 Tax=Ilumatobacter sp. TaxID=1967498 RepID=UPI003B515EAF